MDARETRKVELRPGRAVRILPLLGALLSAPAVSQPPAPPPVPSPTPELLTLERAVELAMAGNVAVRNAALEVERAEERIAAARTRRLPKLDLSATGSYLLTPLQFSFERGAFGVFPGIGPVPGADTVVEVPRKVAGLIDGQVAQPLTQLHKVGLSVELAQAARDLERERLRGRKLAVTAEVKRAYFAVVATASERDASAEALASYRELDRLVADYVAKQTALRPDLLDVRARLAAEELRARKLDHDLATGREQLNDLLGRDLDTPFTVESVPAARAEEVDLAAARAQARERRPDLAQGRLRKRQAELDRRLTRADRIPDLSFAVTYYSNLGLSILPRNFTQIGLQLSWEPFDWGRRRHQEADKERAVTEAENGLREAERQALLDVDRRFRQLDLARRQIDVRRLAEEAAAERLRVTKSRFAEQAALLKDVLAAQQAHSQAAADRQQALLGYWTARADFAQALGEEP